MEDGYAIQQHLVQRLLDDGEVIVGYKLGLTSMPMQQLLGVDSPDFGPVFASGVFRDGAVLPVDRFIAPRVEAEIGVILASDLAGPALHTGAGAGGDGGARRGAGDRGLADRGLADQAGGHGRGPGEQRCDRAELAGGARSTGSIPRLLGMVFTKNGEVVATGAGAAALGDPLAAVAWLANTLAPMGVTLPAGSVIMTGALHAMVPVAPGDVFRADFDRLGPITIRMAHDETLRRSRCGARSWGPATSART